MTLLQEEPDDSDEQHLCPICYQPFESYSNLILIKHHYERIDHAQNRAHVFHQHCITRWLETSDDHSCPLDRQKISRLVELDYSQIIKFNINRVVKDNYRLLEQIVKYPRVNILDQLQDINQRDGNGKTLFYCACQRGQLSIVKKLKKQGADPIISDFLGFTPLMATVTQNHQSLVSYLVTLPRVLKYINETDYYHKSALQYAIDHQRWTCLRILLNPPPKKLDRFDHRLIRSILRQLQRLYLIRKDLIIRYLIDSAKKILGIKNPTHKELKNLGIPQFSPIKKHLFPPNKIMPFDCHY